MSSKKISELASGGDVAPTDQFVVARGGDNFRVAGAALLGRHATYVTAPLAAGITEFGSVDWTAGRETNRLDVNAWIKAQGHPVIDVEPLLTDGGSPPALAATYDSGDGLHPNNAGAKKIADAVFATVFGGSPVIAS